MRPIFLEFAPYLLKFPATHFDNYRCANFSKLEAHKNSGANSAKYIRLKILYLSAKKINE